MNGTSTALSWRTRWLLLRCALQTLATGRHVYVATSCIHGDHAYCQRGVRGDGGPKRPATCKFASEPCACWCHGQRQAGTSR